MTNPQASYQCRNILVESNLEYIIAVTVVSGSYIRQRKMVSFSSLEHSTFEV